jgi:predicted RND superfamily exporter protein
MAAFSSMAVAGLRMVAEYGFMSFIAITFSALSVLLFSPSFLVLETKIGRRTFDMTKISNALGMRGILVIFMTKISNYAINKPFGVILFLSVALVPTFYGISTIETMTDGDMWLPQEMPAIKANKIIDKEFGEYGYSMILVEADDIRTPEIMNAIIDVENAVRNVPYIVEVSSIASMMNPLPNDKRDIDAKLSAIPFDTRRQYVTKDYTEALIIIKASEGFDEEVFFKEIDDAVESVQTPGDAIFVQAGFSKLFSKMDSIMEKDQEVTTLASLILVIILLYFAVRGFTGVIIGLTPVLLAILFTMGIMGLLDIPSTPLTIMLATLLLGLGIDYSIHFMSRYREERKNGYSLEKSLLITSSTVGESLASTSITTIFGFLSLATMALIPVQDFGKVAAIGLFLCAIFVPLIITVGFIFHERVVDRALLFLPLPWRRKRDLE